MAMDSKGIKEKESMRDVTPWCRISIDREGRWFYDGQEIVNPGVLQAFHQALERCGDGRYRIVLNQEICYVEVEDTPFVVLSVRGDKTQGFTLILNSGHVHALDPATLCIGKDNIMYARLANGMPVRLSRPAYYILATAMEEDPDGKIFLQVGQQRYPIPTQPQP